MIDTIALTLPEYHFVYRFPERFSPHLSALINAPPCKEIMKAIYNPTRQDKETGYKPRLTIFRRPVKGAGMALFLRIEFSAPKMLYGNNFVELKGDDDFEPLLEALQKALSQMGIIVKTEHLAVADISSIHYSKNVILSPTTPCFMLLQQLEKMDFSAKLDLEKSDFRNEGQMVKYHASSYEIALYDKAKDMERGLSYGAKRGVENEYNSADRDLFGSKKPEVLRIEIRLHRRKLKTVLTKLNITVDLTLAGLFRQSISQSVVTHYWQEITKGMYIHTIDTKDVAALIQNIRRIFPSKTTSKVLELACYVRLCQEHGIRGASLVTGATPAQLVRLKSDTKQLSSQAFNPRMAILKEVRDELLHYAPLTAKDLYISA